MHEMLCIFISYTMSQEFYSLLLLFNTLKSATHSPNDRFGGKGMTEDGRSTLERQKGMGCIQEA